jgi:predicted alpha/beta superfamily hydrolase
VVNLAGSARGHLEGFPDFKATRLNNSRNVLTYLPPGYEESDVSYPVLYMHDGQNAYNDPKSGMGWGGWEVNLTLDDLIGKDEVEPVIVAAVDNALDREGEYVGSKKPMYADFLMAQVVPFIDKTYRTKPDKANRAVMGSSYGGVISFWLTYAYNAADYGYGSIKGWEMFSKAACLSSTFDVNNSENIKMVTEKKPIAYYLDSGSPNDNTGVTIEMRDKMITVGWTLNADLWYYLDEGAAHNEAAWRARLHIPLTYFYGK